MMVGTALQPDDSRTLGQDRAQEPRPAGVRETGGRSRGPERASALLGPDRAYGTKSGSGAVRRRTGFTIVELLVVTAVLAVLLSLLLPGLSGARDAARELRCLSNQRQLVLAWTGYAVDHHDRVMPLAYFEPPDLSGNKEQVFWWGSLGNTANAPEVNQGFLSPYLDSNLAERSIYECPSQGWGSYKAQGPNKSITSTYGYNGYYLSPGKTPGWNEFIKHRPWRRVADLETPTKLAVFADTLLPASANSSTGSNTALLDPPMLFDGQNWTANPYPTTAFRHGAKRLPRTNVACADGGVRGVNAEPDWITFPLVRVGSLGTTNDPWYVPDWKEWPAIAN